MNSQGIAAPLLLILVAAAIALATLSFSSYLIQGTNRAFQHLDVRDGLALRAVGGTHTRCELSSEIRLPSLSDGLESQRRCLAPRFDAAAPGSSANDAPLALCLVAEAAGMVLPPSEGRCR